ncbi:WW domain-containing protein tag-325 isoform X2 [Bombyx mori]|uniref:Rho GTPase-activating protein 15 n=1 Tax=Bombyx mori TaxID=7091 RepID=A0A8R2M2E6_BOMMO|nr:WW domain-containing protein tag-325 isoform X2 [Bombyx mori]
MCEVASWIPDAVAVTLRDASSVQPVLAWLTALRASTEDYDQLPVVVPAEESSRASPDSAFDEILSQLGKEIFKLEEYHQNLLPPPEKEVSLSILNIFDECLDRMSEKQCNGNVEECSECESTLSDVSMATSLPAKSADVNSDVNCIFDKGEGTPVPPRRTRFKSSSSVVVGDNMEENLDGEQRSKCTQSDSDSESTCWSYKECSTETEQDGRGTYAEVWSHSSGFHNSDEILRSVLRQNHATVSCLSLDSARDLEPASFSVYALHEVGDRCVSPVAAMTPDRPIDPDYEPVRDALTDENIYEEIEYSYTDEGCSCGTSVEVETYSTSSGRETPLYANLTDNDAYAITPDVIFWKNLLLDPFYNEDEEDEWITPEECAIYTRDQRPPLVIPRITQYRQPRRDQRITQPYPEDSSDLSLQARNERQNWNSNLGRNRVELERNFSKNASESPPFIRINKNLSGSTENLLISNVRRPNFLQIPASSSGDSLDIEIRDREVSHARSRKSRSMVAPNKRINKSPVPAPRLALQQNPEALVILEGPVKRTKFFEGRKKMKKSWTDCYMILIQTALVFYKDQRTYNATKVFKPPGTPPSPAAPRAELVLPLRDARIRQCIAMHTRRHNRSLVLIVDYDQYLVQDETEEGARKWLQAIQRVIYSLYPTADYDCPTPSNQSSTDLDSLGRTPPTSRHNRNKQKVGGSSNEDLSDSTETSIQKTHVKSRLRKFFAKRPAMEVLVKKGIYKDEPVFGRNLAEVCPQTSPQVPEFVVACVNEIESSDENLCTDGLYRASGNLSQVQKIRLEIDQNNTSVISKNSDIHVLTGSLKLFFRELKEPLIPYSLFHRVLAACSIKPREAKIKEFREIIQALPQCNRDTLKFLLEHLLRVQQYSEKNRMHIANLAIVFGPTILWAPVTAKARNIAVDCIQQNNVVDILLNEFNEIFSEENKTKKKA